MSPNSILLNPNNVHGGAFTTDPTGAVANSGNRLYGHAGGSAAALRGEGLYSVTGGNGMPSAVQKQMGGSTCGSRMMAGGGRRRKSKGKRSRKNKRSRSSKKYGRKRSLTYRMKHRRSRSRKVKGARRAQAGGYQQYMSNTPFSLGFRTPGFGLTSGTSALANPVPFMPYDSSFD
jgi:hypothetical protein